MEIRIIEKLILEAKTHQPIKFRIQQIYLSKTKVTWRLFQKDWEKKKEKKRKTHGHAQQCGDCRAKGGGEGRRGYGG